MTWQDIPGAFDFMAIYDEAVARAKDGDILVEVGMMLGCSAAYLARKVLDSGKRLQVYGVDSWERDKWDVHYYRDATETHGGPFNMALAHLREHAREELEVLRILRCDSARAARFFDDASVAFVFIDGLHTYEAVRGDIAAWRSKIAPDGTLAGHDHTGSYPGVEQACKEAFGAGGYRVLTAPPGGQDSWMLRR